MIKSTHIVRQVDLPFAVHATAFPGRSETTYGSSCSMEVLSSFFVSQGEEFDESCTASLVPLGAS